MFVGTHLVTWFFLMIITIDESDKAHACVNSSHAAHMDRKGHSGLHLTIGKGDMANASKKLELNTISSTEQELEGLEYNIPEIMDIKDPFV